MFDIIPLILIILSLIIIMVIVIKKFPVLAALNVESIQRERENEFKQRIISNKLKRNFYKNYSKFKQIIFPIGSFFKKSIVIIYNKLLKVRENYKNENLSQITKEDIPQKFIIAQKFREEENLNEAEKKYIEIISADTKNLKAFQGIGQVYYYQKNYNEAKQTFVHILKLVENSNTNLAAQYNLDQNNFIAETYYDLAGCLIGLEDYNGALNSVNSALKIEPKNPRFLDLKIEICIINKDRKTAFRAYDKLADANPQNAKLIEIRKVLEEIN